MKDMTNKQRGGEVAAPVVASHLIASEQNAGYWVCPCGETPPKRGAAQPVETRVSLSEPRCPFCNGKFKPEGRR